MREVAESMKKFSVSILFKNGKEFQFESVDNPLLIQPVHINGAKIIMTRDQYVVNLLPIKKMQVTERGKGIVGALVIK